MMQRRDLKVTSNYDATGYTALEINEDAEKTSHSSEQTEANLSTWQVIKQLSSLIISAENIPQIVGAGVLTTASIGLNFLSPYLLGETIRLLSSDNEEETSDIAGYKLNRQALISLLVCTYTLSQVLPNLRDQIMVSVTSHNTKIILARSTQHLLERSLDYHVKTSFSDQIYFIQKGFSVTAVGTPLLTQIAPTLFEVGLACIMLSRRYGLEMGLGLLGLISVFTAYSMQTTEKIINSREIALAKGNDVWDQFTDAVTRYKTIRDFGKFPQTMHELDKALEKMIQSDIHAAKIPSKISLGHIGMTRVAMLLASIYIGAGVQIKRFTVQDFVMLVGYLNQLAGALPAFGQAVNQLFSFYPDLKFVFSKLVQPSEVLDLHPETLLQIDENEPPEIEFDGVTFGYPFKPGEKEKAPLFHNLSFKVRSGQTVALVSESGAGKSTLFNLLYGYYSPNQGTIRINGQNIAEVSLVSLQNSITLIEQSANLFKGTIRQNIAYGAEHPELMTDDMIWELAREAHLVDFLNKFPNQLDTEVGENGKALSGGQQQKVALLRGLAKKTSIRLLDEITAPFDSQSAKDVLSSIQQHSQGITTLMITHKLTEAQQADQILLIAEGQIVAQGTHDELLISSPAYQKLWQAYQNKGHDSASSCSTTTIISALGGSRCSSENEEFGKEDYFIQTAEKGVVGLVDKQEETGTEVYTTKSTYAYN